MAHLGLSYGILNDKHPPKHVADLELVLNIHKSYVILIPFFLMVLIRFVALQISCAADPSGLDAN